jgi:hypothetical protein
MTYHQDIQSNLKTHVRNLESIGEKEVLSKKVLRHFEKTIQIFKIIDGERLEDYKFLIEHLNQE